MVLMMAIDPFFGSLIGAGTQLLGGLLGSSATEKANERAANEAAANRRMQDEVNRRGLTMRADDAMNAYKLYGIHPLSMLGANAPTYSPVSAAFLPDTSVADSIGKAGQSIEKGLYAGADREARAAAVARTNELHSLAVERGKLENTALRMKIESDAMRMQNSPSVGLPSSNTGDVIAGQNQRTNVVGPSYEYVKTPHGYMFLKSKAAQERLEDDVVGTSLWNAGHRGYVPPIPRGVQISPYEKWVWRPVSQEWQVHRMTKEDYRRLLPFSVSGRHGKDIPPLPFQGDFMGRR